MTSENTKTEFDLKPLRKSGWLRAQIARDADLEDVCTLLGEEFVAIALLYGVQLYQIDKDDQFLPLTNFTLVGNGHKPFVLNATELREQLILLVDSDFENLKGAAFDALKARVGTRFTMLLDALVDTADDNQVVDIERLVENASGEIEVVLASSEPTSLPATRSLTTYLDSLKSHLERQAFVRTEAGLVPVIEMSARARTLEAADDQVSALSAFPRLLSALGRSVPIDRIDDAIAEAVGSGTALLCAALQASGRRSIADDIARAGLNWLKGGGEASHLYVHLGASAFASGQHGEAIGLLRRGMTLDPSHRARALPLLARAYLARQRYIGAWVCAHDAQSLPARDNRDPLDARSAGVDLEEVKAQANRALGKPWQRFIDAQLLVQSAAQTAGDVELPPASGAPSTPPSSTPPSERGV